MKRALLLAGAMVAAVPAWAEWTQYGVSTEENVGYLDHATIRGTGNMRRAWELFDFSKPNKNGAQSLRMLHEVDCAEGRSRVLQGAYFTGKMGEGEVGFSTNSPTEWSYTAPGTMAATRDSIICRRKAVNL